MRLLVAVGLLGAMALAAASGGVTPARADIYNPQLLPLGERQAFMANTGTGDASDSGAVYYNPAGLADLGRDKVSVNGSFYLNYRIQFEELATINGTAVPYEASGLNTVPSTFVSTLRFGGFNFALSVLVPENLSLENRSAIRAAGIDGQIVQATRYGDLRVGLSTARKLGERFGLGLTVAFSHHNEASIFSAVNHFPGSTNTVSSSTRSLALTSYGLMATLGAKLRLADWLSLGARVQSPLIQLSGQANTYSSTDVTNNGVVTTSDREDRPDQDATYQLPLDSTLGVAFAPVSWFELLGDVSFQAGTSYTNVRNSVFTSLTDVDPTFRYNLGVQLNLSSAWSILAGGYYNPSTIHNLDASRVGESQLDFWGTSLGVIWSLDHVQTGIGGVYFAGSGNFRTSEGALNDSSVSGLGVLITTAYVF